MVRSHEPWRRGPCRTNLANPITQAQRPPIPACALLSRLARSSTPCFHCLLSLYQEATKLQPDSPRLHLIKLVFGLEFREATALLSSPLLALSCSSSLKPAGSGSSPKLNL